MADKEEPKDKGPEGEDGSVGMLRRQLYAREEPEDIKKRVEDLQRPSVAVTQAAAPEAPELVNVMEKRTKRRRKILLGVGVALAVLMLLATAIAATLWYRRSRQVAPEQIGAVIKAPADVVAGEQVEYSIEYANNSRVDWDSVEVTFTPPAGFLYEESEPAFEETGRVFVLRTGELPAGESGEAKVRGRLLGEPQDSLLAQANVVIVPSNFPQGTFSQTASVSTTISSTSLEVSIEADEKAGDGERLLMNVQVRNVGEETMSGALLRLLPAEGMQLAPDDEQFSSGYSVLDGWWELPDIEPFGLVERQAVVYVKGQAGEKKGVKAQALVRHEEEFFVQREIDHVITITASSLAVEQTLNDKTESFVVKAGEKVKGVITYANTGTTGLGNVVVTLAFSGEGLDASTLDLKGGAYDPVTKTIRWTSASVSQLADLLPGQEGKVEYSFSILPTSAYPTTDAAKNQSLALLATVDSPDIPAPVGQERKVSSDRVTLPIGTDLTLAADAFYDDGRLGLESSGPLPPEVGETTTYTVRIRAGTTLNDVGELRVRAVLPEAVTYTGNMYKTAGEMTYDERTGQLEWVVAQLPGLTGRAAPPAELHVQVAITPGENLRGKSMEFLNSVTAEALDLFTDETVQVTVTALPTTSTADRDNGTVE